MSLLTTIDSIPLYTTIQEAVGWAANNGLSGYHEHIYKEQLGYMGGTSHETAIEGPVTIPTPIPMPTTTTTTTTTPTTPATSTTPTGGTGGGGGGGGY